MNRTEMVPAARRRSSRQAMQVPMEQRMERRGVGKHNVGLALIDQALIILGFGFAYYLRYQADWPPPLELWVSEVATENQVAFSAFLPIMALMQLLLLLRFAAAGSYHRRRPRPMWDQVGLVVNSVITATALLIVFVFLYRPFYYSRLIFVFAGLAITALLTLRRLITAGVEHWNWGRGAAGERVLVIGGTGIGQLVMNGIATSPGLGYQFVGYLDERPIVGEDALVYRHLGPIERLADVISDQQVSLVIIALPFWEQGRLPTLAAVCERLGIEFLLAPDVYQLNFDRVDTLQLSGVPLLRPRGIKLLGLNLVLKRVIDVTAVVCTLPLTLPLMALVALAILRFDGRPVIFRQQRIGKNGRPFTCFKFRTMVPDAEARRKELEDRNEADGPIFKIENDPRVTRLGRILRSTSLDELPQLFNVLRGEMSIIGPRPALPEEVAEYETWQCRRLQVLPGIAGLPQALGRSHMKFDEQVRLDIYYAENWSPSMDLRILLMVLPAVLSRRGAF
jgi:exopolysaccharide biosynthesis polyprenyl glycosylphosphotransferase